MGVVNISLKKEKGVWARELGVCYYNLPHELEHIRRGNNSHSILQKRRPCERSSAILVNCVYHIQSAPDMHALSTGVLLVRPEAAGITLVGTSSTWAERSVFTFSAFLVRHYHAGNVRLPALFSVSSNFRRECQSNQLVWGANGLVLEPSWLLTSRVAFSGCGWIPSGDTCFFSGNPAIARGYASCRELQRIHQRCLSSDRRGKRSWGAPPSHEGHMGRRN